MQLKTEILSFRTKGHTDIIDITSRLQRVVEENRFKEGLVCLFVIGSTASVTTVEFEPGLVESDLPALFEKLAPYRANYAHHGTWGDDNGAAHLRASLLGSSLTVPFSKSKLLLGTWQQVILLDFDTRSRNRELVAQLWGIK